MREYDELKKELEDTKKGKNFFKCGREFKLKKLQYRRLKN